MNKLTKTKNQNKNHRSEGANTPLRENYPPPLAAYPSKAFPYTEMRSTILRVTRLRLRS